MAKREKVKISEETRLKIKAELYATNPYYKQLVDERKAKREKRVKFIIPKKRPKSKKVKKHPLAHLFNKSYSSFLKSAYWSKVRLTVLKRDNYTCICGEKKYL